MTTLSEGRDEERKIAGKADARTEKVLSPVHTESRSRQRMRHLPPKQREKKGPGVEEGERKKEKRCRGTERRDVAENFPRTFPGKATIAGREKPAKETSARGERVVRRSFDHLGNEMPGNWKSLNALRVCEDAYGNRHYETTPFDPLRTLLPSPVLNPLLFSPHPSLSLSSLRGATHFFVPVCDSGPQPIGVRWRSRL